MRYLWVEDFNDESNNDTGEVLRERLEDCFDLKNDKIIIKRDLSSTIEFLEDKKNLHEIDAILIDIRFPEGTRNNIYSEYFNDIVTADFYSKNINDASGIMLYLLMIFRYHISQNKMAFISANISSNNSKIKVIQDMVEIIVKSKYQALSYEDKMSYKTLERNLGVNILNIQGKDKIWGTFISKEGFVENISLDKLLDEIKSLPSTHSDKFIVQDRLETSNAQVKYNAVKEQFDKIGFVMPSAFEKPKMGDQLEKRYTFLEWEKTLYDNQYNAVRSNIQEMCIILIKILQQKDSKILYSDFLNLLTCNENEKQIYDCLFFVRYLENLKGIFSIDCEENMEVRCERAIKEISALWEASTVPKYEKKVDDKRSVYIKENKERIQYIHNDNCYFACHATMKIIRNWIGHQGIQGVNIIDVGFVFLICMRGLFDLEKLELSKEGNQYLECEKRILSLFEKGDKYTEDIEESLSYFFELNNATKSGENNSKRIYDKISGLGHVNSTIRREVSMDEIYMLFYHAISLENIDEPFKCIVNHINIRTWKNWKNRYNERFEIYKKLV